MANICVVDRLANITAFVLLAAGAARPNLISTSKHTKWTRRYFGTRSSKGVSATCGTWVARINGRHVRQLFECGNPFFNFLHPHRDRLQAFPNWNLIKDL